MKKVLGFILIFFSMQIYAEKCPSPEEIHPSRYMGMTIYRADDYMSRWIYDPNLVVKGFIKAEGSAEQLNECWYKAERSNDPKVYMITLSPTILIKPDLSHKNWKRSNNYVYCLSNDPNSCPLSHGKRLNYKK